MNTIALRIGLTLALACASVPALAESGHGKHEGHTTGGHHGHADLSERTLKELLGQLDETMKSIMGCHREG